MNELKPCPLCGKTHKVKVTTRKVYDMAFPNGGGCVSVECSDCHIGVIAHSEIDAPIDATYEMLKESAIKKWNQIKR